MINISADKCCGCAACENACPTKAIQMLPNKEGFKYPCVESALCCNCGKCEKACPIITPPKLSEKIEACFVAQSKDENVLNESTSGGFVDSLCKYVLEVKKGYVCGVAFDSDFMPHHKIVDSYEQAKAFRNSKYAQSNIGTVYRDILVLLKAEKTVMFIGTPCQVAGLMAYLGRDYENLITVDLVCRSIPSPKLWRDYLDWQEKRYGSKIKSVYCRKKTYGYHSGALEITFENGKRYKGSNRIDYFMKSFHKDICSRKSCYECNFKTKNRCSDFTVFDSWRPKAAAVDLITDNDRGFSSVILHKHNRKKIVEDLNDLAIFDADVNILLEYTGGMAVKSIVKPSVREDFYVYLDDYGFLKTVKKYTKVSFMDFFIEFLKPIKYRINK